MAIGIDLRVDHSQVSAAKREVDLLTGSLRSAKEHSDISIGTSGLDSFAMPDFSRFADAIKQMQGMSGLAATGMPVNDRVARVASELRRETERTQKSVSDTARDYDKIIKTVSSLKGLSGTTTLRGVATSGTTDITEGESKRMRRASQQQADDFWKSTVQEPKRKKTYAELYQEQHGDRGRVVMSRDDVDGAGVGTAGRNNSGQFMRRALGWGAAAAGIGSIAAYVAASRSAYRSAVDEESLLFAKGITGSRGRAGMAARIGIAPSEYYGLENALSRTGLNGKNIGREAMLTASFAKSSGLEISELAGLRSTLFNATGSNTRVPDGVIASMTEATARGMSKAKLPELLLMIGRNTNISAQAMHGVGLGDRQVGALTAQATEAMLLKDGTSFKNFAKSREFSGFMQDGLQSTGSTAGDLTKAQLMGVFDGPMSFSKIFDIKSMEQGGFAERPDLLKRFIDQARTMSGNGDDKSVAGALGTLDERMAGRPALSLVQMANTGFFDRLEKGLKGGKSIEQMAASGDKDAARYLSEIKNNPALSRQAQEAKADVVKIEAGEQLSKLFLPLESAATSMAGALASGEWKKSFSIMEKAAGEMGPVGKTLLAAGGLFAAGGALSAVGGAMSLGGKGAGMLGALSGPGGILAALGLGGAAAYGTFKDGGNFMPPEKLNAITGKSEVTGKFSKKFLPFQDSFGRAAKNTGVNVDLLYSIARAESGFNPRALSPKGAGGVMQLMPNTAASLGIKNNFDPEQNIQGGAKYFKTLMDQYGGNQDKALAEYNWGPGNLDKWTKNHEFNVDELPKETREYVRKVGNGASAYGQGDQQASNGGSDPALQMIADILRTIMGHSETTAINTGTRIPIARPLALSAK